TLLAAMQTPIQSEVTFYQAPGGRLLLRQAFTREKENQKELSVFDSLYLVPDGFADALSRANEQIETNKATLAAQVTDSNRPTQKLNDRIAQVLRVVAKQDLPAEPPRWWKWWYDYNEIAFSSEKSVSSQYAYSVDQIQGTPIRTFASVSRHSACLTAG